MSGFFKFRLFPVTLAASALFVLVKVDEIAMSQKYLARGIIPPAYAASSDDEAASAKKSADAMEKIVAEDESESEKRRAEVAEAIEESQNPQGENANILPSEPQDILGSKGQYSQIEVDILQSLTKRRQEIEQFAKELSMREKVLSATEMRIDDKIEEMEGLQRDLKEQLENNKKREDSEMRSLVKIYESMKPKEAARIFDELDMNILLEVIDRMSERKAAPILAGMAPTKAKDVTVKLAEMRQLRQRVSRDLTEGALAESN